MDVNEYKELCARPDVLQRGALEDTVRVLREARSPDARLVEEILRRAPIEKPVIHAAGAEADSFFVTLDADVVESIVEQLADAEAAAVSPAGGTTPEANRMAELRDLWTRCQEYLENGGAA